MGSVTIALRDGDPPPHSLALVAALALCRTLREMGAPAAVQIKWPNDIMVDGAKLAGILLERSGNHAVLGIGVNIVQAPVIADRKTVSLAAIGCPLARDQLADTLARQWCLALKDWRTGGWPAAILADWLAAAHPRGTPLTLTEGEHRGLTGRFDGLERDGALALMLDDGRRIIVHAGDVALADDLQEGTGHAAGH